MAARSIIAIVVDVEMSLKIHLSVILRRWIFLRLQVEKITPLYLQYTVPYQDAMKYKMI